MHRDYVRWFISLIQKDMREYDEDIETKQLLYQSIKRELENRRIKILKKFHKT